jgi:hypothetical protein
MIKVHYMQVWNCHNETPHFLQLIYTNKTPPKYSIVSKVEYIFKELCNVGNTLKVEIETMKIMLKYLHST